MFTTIINFLRRRKLVTLIEQVAPADSKYSTLSTIGINYIKLSGYQLMYVEWRDLPLWVLEYYASRCIASNEGLKLKYPTGKV